MPIGFWAISRNEIREMMITRTGHTPSHELLDKIVRTLPEVLDRALDDHIEYYAPQVIKENS